MCSRRNLQLLGLRRSSGRTQQSASKCARVAAAAAGCNMSRFGIKHPCKTPSDTFLIAARSRPGCGRSCFLARTATRGQHGHEHGKAGLPGESQRCKHDLGCLQRWANRLGSDLGAGRWGHGSSLPGIRRVLWGVTKRESLQEAALCCPAWQCFTPRLWKRPLGSGEVLLLLTVLW